MEKERIFALGFFDGVHLGHQALLGECAALAKRMGCQAAAITFDRHPQSLFRPDPPRLISTLQDRHLLLMRYGMEHVYDFAVTKEVMGQPWQDFLEQLVECGAVGFVCGDDFRFGAGGKGDVEKLAAFCKERGLPCIIVPEQTLNGIRISSTYIRRQLEEGDMETAVRFLGHGYTLTGEVVPGRHLGHKLGFPTANVLLPEEVVCPKHGVYACKVRVGGRDYPAVTNVGSRPTVNGHQVRTESWILDFDADLYGEAITLRFHRFLRPERKFDSLTALKEQVLADAEQTRKYFEIS